MKIRTYSELRRIPTFEERYQYLRLTGMVGETTFGFDRYLNQILYTSSRWRRTRDNIIIRDDGCDLGMRDYEINGIIYIHHMNPLTIEDVGFDRPIIYDPRFLICTSFNTHNAIHFGSESLLPQLPIERRPNDTCPWK
jgi:hypothetical protein